MMSTLFRFAHPPRRCPAVGLLACLLVFGVAFAGRLEENTLKAAMVVNIARFTEWPALDAERLRLCVYDPDGEMLAAFRALPPKRIHQRELKVRAVRRALDLDRCDLLFVRDPARIAVSRLLAAAESRPLLSIGDMPGFTDAGGIVNLIRHGRKLRLEVNLGAARAAGLRISSRLLKLATITGDPR